MRRRVVILAGLTVLLVLLAWPAAGAKDLGTDVIGNISPGSRLDHGALVDRYPLSAFSLDYHTDVGISELDGVPPTIAQWAAAQIWSLTSFLIKMVIDLLTWAFSLDLLSGNPNRPDDGALAPMADAITNLYENVIGQTWMVAALIGAGIWGIWKALIQRRYTETAAALTMSVVFVLMALFFVYQPERTVGTASQWTNTLSLAFLSGANRGTLDDPGQAKRQVADQLFETLIYRPWAVLEFGGLRHCVDTDRRDDDGYPKPVAPDDPVRDVCRDHLKQGSDGHGGYGPRFLAHPAGSSERNAEYEALRKGEVPEQHADQFRGYAVDKTDSPAVDIQQEHGSFQRLTLSAVFLLGVLGAVVLLGFLSLAVVLAQVVALVLLGFAPVALVIGVFPGAGHDFFRNWLGKLATAVFIKALYSLVIAIVVAVSTALTNATSSLGFLFAFGLQAIFFWAIFLYRKQITTRLLSATTGSHFRRDERTAHLPVVQRASTAAAHPFHALVGSVGGPGRRQQSALTATSAPEPEPQGPISDPTANNEHVVVASKQDNPPPAAQNGHPPRGPGLTPGSPLAAAAATPASRSAGGSSPRAAHAEVLARADALRHRTANDRPDIEP